MPSGVKTWKQNSKVSVDGNVATRVITRTCQMKDGTTKVVVKTFTKEFTV